MKHKRHAKLLELIQNNNIETQEELSERLSKCGFEVTQATISRDIKELRIIKTLSDKGTYKYAVSDSNNSSKTNYHNILLESVEKIDHANNIIVVKCYVGMAQGACAAIDSMKLNGIVGTLAGDDTIFIVTANEAKAIEITNSLRNMID